MQCPTLAGIHSPPVIPQLDLSVGGPQTQFNVRLQTEAANATGGLSYGYTYAWTLFHAGVNRSALLSATNIQNPTWTPDAAGDWEVSCEVSDGVSTTARTRVHSVGSYGWILRGNFDLTSESHNFKTDGLTHVITGASGETLLLTLAANDAELGVASLSAAGLTLTQTHAAVTHHEITFVLNDISGWTAAIDEEVCVMVAWNISGAGAWNDDTCRLVGAVGTEYSCYFGPALSTGGGSTFDVVSGRVRGGTDSPDTQDWASAYPQMTMIQVDPLRASAMFAWKQTWVGSFDIPEGASWNLYRNCTLEDLSIADGAAVSHYNATTLACWLMNWGFTGAHTYVIPAFQVWSRPKR